METFQDVVNSIKSQLSELCIDEYNSEKYKIKTCEINRFKTHNSLRIEILFLDNLEYLSLTPSQNKKLLVGNYKNLFTSCDILQKYCH